MTIAKLLELRRHWRREGKTVVWTNGCFDLVHVGHVRSLMQARRLGDVLVVGVNADESVRAMKGRNRPIVPAHERAEIIDALRPVDAVVVFGELVPTNLVAKVMPDVYCKGEDYRERHLPEADVVRSYGGIVEFLPLVPHRSTSSVVARLWAET